VVLQAPDGSSLSRSNNVTVGVVAHVAASAVGFDFVISRSWLFGCFVDSIAIFLASLADTALSRRESYKKRHQGEKKDGKVGHRR